MAVYKIDVKIFSRGKGGCVTRAAAYRAGERIRDERPHPLPRHNRAAWPYRPRSHAGSSGTSPRALNAAAAPISSALARISARSSITPLECSRSSTIHAVNGPVAAGSD
jgi:hypothetical protein